MAACCLYGAFLMGLFLRKYELFNSFRLSDKITQTDTESLTELPRPALSGLDRWDEFDVSGMTCTSCSNAVQSSLTKVDGVKRANVDILRGRVQIVHDCTRATTRHMKQAIEDAGFTAVHKTESGKQHRTLDQRLAMWNFGEAFTWSLFFVIPILGLGALRNSILEEERRQLYILLLAGFVQFGLGLPFHRRTWLMLSSRLPLSMDVLVSASTTTAFCTSVAFYLWDDSTSYATMTATLISVLSLGKHLESHARVSIADTLEAFTRTVPSEARVLSSGGTSTVVPVQMLRDNDLVLVGSGQRFPCDGKLYWLPSGLYADTVEIDESFHTGEALPVVRTIGDICLAGTRNSSPLPALIEIQNAEEATARLAAIAKALVDSQIYKSRTQTAVESAMACMVPAILLLAIASFVGWLLVGTLDDALRSLVATLVVACPCALGLSTPAALMIAIATCSEHGIILRRGAQAVEALAKADTVVFDKTGTLTHGRVMVTQRHISKELPRQLTRSGRWWQLVYAAELEASHWAATAIFKHVDALSTQELSGVHIAEVTLRRERSKFVPGRGVSCLVDGTCVVVGNEELLRSHGIDTTHSLEHSQLLSTGETCVFVAFDGKYAGMIGFADSVRTEAKGIVNTIQAHGLETFMMTGDRESSAAEVAKEVGIKIYFPGMTPQAKAAEVQALERGGRIIVMVGDGVNDAIALASATGSIALHHGSPLATASADIVLLGSSIKQIPVAVEVAKAVDRTIRHNIQWAIIYNAILLPAAMGLLRPMGVTLHP